jgi:hypothetical protein
MVGEGYYAATLVSWHELDKIKQTEEGRHGTDR